MSVLILASASPRRRELLDQIGVPHQVMPVDLCEDPLDDEAPTAYVARLACEKAKAGFLAAGSVTPALGSDTAVILDDEILGKPRDEADALSMLRRLSGRKHQVMTAVAVVDGERCICETVITEVNFVAFDESRARAYWASGEPADKAGAYGIQGLGAVLVDSINGSYSAVVGLPLAQTAAILKEFDIEVWQTSSDPKA
ncbi:Septum formation protein Maf [Marinobacterium lacunae]|uniref:dTTP/UTP pyrophosphatase n=1 Tax=Marinobacterium lacunae TaxID=1232683 RepID=A0A081FXL8_9GAMM|nr:Maf family protein [Marinobacterium lacunae]KEA63273.1 Septum formation protein Maf [Marinobacterium lacunae]